MNWFRHQKAAGGGGGIRRCLSGHRTSAAGCGRLLANAGRLRNIDEQVGLTERELQNLIYDARKIRREPAAKRTGQEAERIELARQGLQEDVERLTKLAQRLI